MPSSPYYLLCPCSGREAGGGQGSTGLNERRVGSGDLGEHTPSEDHDTGPLPCAMERRKGTTGHVGADAASQRASQRSPSLARAHSPPGLGQLNTDTRNAPAHQREDGSGARWVARGGSGARGEGGGAVPGMRCTTSPAPLRLGDTGLDGHVERSRFEPSRLCFPNTLFSFPAGLGFRFSRFSRAS